MCFSNLPVEFDENGDPYLAEDADDVDRPGEDGHAETEAVSLDADPESAYETIVESVPESTRRHLPATSEAADGD